MCVLVKRSNTLGTPSLGTGRVYQQLSVMVISDHDFHNLDKSRPQIPRMIQSAMRSAFVLVLTCSLR